MCLYVIKLFLTKWFQILNVTLSLTPYPSPNVTVRNIYHTPPSNLMLRIMCTFPNGERMNVFVCLFGRICSNRLTLLFRHNEWIDSNAGHLVWRDDNSRTFENKNWNWNFFYYTYFYLFYLFKIQIWKNLIMDIFFLFLLKNLAVFLLHRKAKDLRD